MNPNDFVYVKYHSPTSWGGDDSCFKLVLSSWSPHEIRAASDLICDFASKRLRSFPVQLEETTLAGETVSDGFVNAPSFSLVIALPELSIRPVEHNVLKEGSELWNKFMEVMTELESLTKTLIERHALSFQVLRKIDPTYQPTFRPAVRILVKYGEHIGKEGVIVGTGLGPGSTHRVKLDSGTEVDINEDLLVVGKDIDVAEWHEIISNLLEREQFDEATSRLSTLTKYLEDRDLKGYGDYYHSKLLLGEVYLLALKDEAKAFTTLSELLICFDGEASKGMLTHSASMDYFRTAVLLELLFSRLKKDKAQASKMLSKALEIGRTIFPEDSAEIQALIEKTKTE